MASSNVISKRNYKKDKGFSSKRGFIKRKGPCITISRESGAGSGIVAEHLNQILNLSKASGYPEWEIYDKNLLSKIMEDHNLPSRIAKLYTQEKQSELTNMLNEFIGLQPSVIALYRKASKTILEIANKGNAVIVGRAGNLVTFNLGNSFHVRLVSPIENRIKQIQEYYGFGRKEAAEWINKEDGAREKFYRKIFLKSIHDPHYYHIVINTGIMTYKEAAETIAYTVMKKLPYSFKSNVLSEMQEYSY